MGHRSDKHPTKRPTGIPCRTAFAGLGHVGHWADHLATTQRRQQALRDRTVDKGGPDEDHETSA